jgi:predicted nucleic acid-binding protein
MSIVFADTFYYLSFLSENDAAHARAMAFSQSYVGKIVTTGWILTEVADALARPHQRAHAVALIDRLRSDPSLTIVPTSELLFGRGLQLYSARQDKEWSLTDCISFIVMEEYGIHDALTGDHHFEQAGFHAVLG